MVPHGMVEFKDEENRECEKRGMGKKRLQRLGHRPPRHHSPRNQHFQKVFVRRNWPLFLYLFYLQRRDLQGLYGNKQ